MPSNQTEVSSSLSTPAADNRKVLRALNWSSFGFALLQNICAAVLAVNGIRVAIGLGSLAAAGGVWPAVFKFHADAIRIPMMVIALVGAIINLLALWQIKRLRERPSAQWRRVPLSSRQKRSERLQFVLSIVTLVLLAFEYLLHRHLAG
jgi:hypothetical protein